MEVIISFLCFYFSVIKIFIVESTRFVKVYCFQWMDPTPLCFFRICFGLLLFLDTFQERGLDDADIRFGDPYYCFFPLMDWVTPVSVQHAGILYSFMACGALGIAVGFNFRLSCFIYLGPYLYFFVLDKSRWNNHSYLFALLTLLLMLSDAGKHISLDRKFGQLSHEGIKGVPRWNYSILRFQLFLLYFFAGIKKLDFDWLAGHSMKNLSKHWMFSPFKTFFSEEVVNYFMVHLGGLFYDLFVGFMLFFDCTKKLAFGLSFMFHGMNSQLFDIGMFPYVCMVSLVLFLKVERSKQPYSSDNTSDDAKAGTNPTGNSQNMYKSYKKTFTLLFLGVYIIIQLFLPFSHFITKGYNTWTKGIYGYSWDMMVNSWETLHQKITVKIPSKRSVKYLDPDVWVSNDRWSSHADMAKQYAKCAERNMASYNVTGVEIYMDIWKSMNGRFQQRIFDPRVNILDAPWSPLEKVTWVLPLLTEFSDYRKTFFDFIATEVSTWTNSSDVLFVADYPGLYFDNFLPPELVNVTITIVTGEILIEQIGSENVTISEPNMLTSDKFFRGENSHRILSGEHHKIHNVSPFPSCYMYTYTNSTVDNNNNSEVEDENNSTYSEMFLNRMKDFISEKYDVFTRGFNFIVSSYLDVFFGIPMVVRRRILD